MDDTQKAVLIKNMADNLPILRKKMNVTQAELAALIGVSRNTLITIETGKKTMTWNMFLSLILIFTKNKETDKLLNVLEIYTDELNDFIKQRSTNKAEEKEC